MRLRICPVAGPRRNVETCMGHFCESQRTERNRILRLVTEGLLLRRGTRISSTADLEPPAWDPRRVEAKAPGADVRCQHQRAHLFLTTTTPSSLQLAFDGPMRRCLQTTLKCKILKPRTLNLFVLSSLLLASVASAGAFVTSHMKPHTATTTS